MEKGRLYIVSTPIGNLEDITLRALRVLKEADLILCEDTRVTHKLLEHYEINVKTASYHKFTDPQKTDYFITLLEEGKNLALVSDAGTPLISDPGDTLVAKCIEKGLKTEAIPGACAFLTALCLSGFDLREFSFFGFLPKKTGELKDFFEKHKNLPHPFAFYESPNRLLATLGIIGEIMPERQLSVSRELTKLFEESPKSTARELIDYFSEKAIKGEIAVVVDKASPETEEITDEDIIALLKKYTREGSTKKDAVKSVMKDLSLPKNRVYPLSIDI
ncbi:MAG: 16S rRNA (cytidine(1402)-2'-O)-methyltransferase [Armatimonadetes bacterium]|nr:16S rRNA (cytidine(1402)-2'-O)-methyltransferase [Candidatus Hippobium faecium]